MPILRLQKINMIIKLGSQTNPAELRLDNLNKDNFDIDKVLDFIDCLEPCLSKSIYDIDIVQTHSL